MSSKQNRDASHYHNVRWTLLLHLIGDSKLMQEVKKLITLCAYSKIRTIVLFQGETGTGKAVASAILHSLSVSVTNKNIYVCRNCGGFTEFLADSELFGHSDNAFTGALREEPGCFNQANGGTLFLDEINSLPMSVQVKLLCVLEDGAVQQVGSGKVNYVEVNVQLASNADLNQLCKANLFRANLLSRINAMTITLPPLRNRPEDIPALTHAFYSEYCNIAGLPGNIKIPRAVMNKLMDYHYPSNIRELRGIIKNAVMQMESRKDNKGLVCDDIQFKPPQVPDRKIIFDPTGMVEGQSIDEQYSNHLLSLYRQAEESGQSVDFSLARFNKNMKEGVLNIFNNKTKSARALDINVGKFRKF